MSISSISYRFTFCSVLSLLTCLAPAKVHAAHNSHAELKAQVKELTARLAALEDKNKQMTPLTDKELVTKASSGTLKLSGAVNRAIQYHSNGNRANIVHVDGINENFSNLRLDAEKQVKEGTKVGAIMEMGFVSNGPENISVRAANDANATFAKNVIEAFVESESLGKLILGFGYNTSDRVTVDTDQSSTTVVGNGRTITQNGAGTIFWDKVGNKNGVTPANKNIRVLDIFSPSPLQSDRVQYETPIVWGTKLSTSHSYARNNDIWDVAIKHASELGSTKFAAQAGYITNNTNRGAGGGDNDVAKYQQLSGSASVLFENGISLMVALSDRKWRLNNAPRGRFSYTKLGYQHKFFEAGTTAFAIDYGQSRNLFLYRGDGNDTNISFKLLGKTYGAMVVQHLERIGTELYLSGRLYKLDIDSRQTQRFKDIQVVTLGMRVKF